MSTLQIQNIQRQNNQRYFNVVTVLVKGSYRWSDRLQRGDSVEYHGRKGRMIAAGWALGQRDTNTVVFDNAMSDRMTVPEDRCKKSGVS